MQERDYKWFKENYFTISEEYGNSFVVIKNKKVIGSFDNYGDAVRETVKKEKLGTFIVQFCNGDESAYTNYISSFNFV